MPIEDTQAEKQIAAIWTERQDYNQTTDVSLKKIATQDQDIRILYHHAAQKQITTKKNWNIITHWNIKTNTYKQTCSSQQNLVSCFDRLLSASNTVFNSAWGKCSFKDEWSKITESKYVNPGLKLALTWYWAWNKDPADQTFDAMLAIHAACSPLAQCTAHWQKIDNLTTAALQKNQTQKTMMDCNYTRKCSQCAKDK
jgi:hypothetical protein